MGSLILFECLFDVPVTFILSINSSHFAVLRRMKLLSLLTYKRAMISVSYSSVKFISCNQVPYLTNGKCWYRKDFVAFNHKCNHKYMPDLQECNMDKFKNLVIWEEEKQLTFTFGIKWIFKNAIRKLVNLAVTVI